MSSNFTHLIITRFNINFKDLYKTKYGDEVNSDDWLTERFDLFDNYCFPSVKQQKNKLFKWLVFFDTNTPEAFKSKITQYNQKFKNFIAIYIDSADMFLGTIQAWISENVNTEYVITTRLDNDDMLHRNFVSIIQQNFQKHEKCIINLPNGLQLNLENSPVELITSYSSFGPFISLIEKKDFALSIYYKQHQAWRSNSKVITLSDVLWLQVIHSKNILNTFKGKTNYILNINRLTDFGIKQADINKLIGDKPSSNVMHNIFVPCYRTILFFKKVWVKCFNTVKTFFGNSH